MKRVLIIGDSRRDAIGISLLQRKLWKGFSVEAYVAAFPVWEQSLMHAAPHAVILNHVIGKRNVAIAKAAKSLGSKVILMPTEGRPNTTSLEKWYVDSHKKNAHLIDLILLWNDIMDFGDKINTIVTGCPRFDVYAQEDIMNNMREKARGLMRIRPRDHLTVVFSSFPQAKFHTRSTEFNTQDWQDLEMPYAPSLFAQSEFIQRKKFRNKIESMELEQLVVKPHPHEDVSYWSRDFSVETMSDAAELIAAADSVVTRWGCMTSLESALAGKPTTNLLYPTEGGAIKDWADSKHDASYWLRNVGDSAAHAAKAISEQLKTAVLDSRVQPNIPELQNVWNSYSVQQIENPIDGIGQTRKNLTLHDVLEVSRV